MAQNIIDTGGTANDGTGDSIRSGFQKVNSNFTEVYTVIPRVTGVETSVTNLTGLVNNLTAVVGSSTGTTKQYVDYSTSLVYNSLINAFPTTIIASTASLTTRVTALESNSNPVSFNNDILLGNMSLAGANTRTAWTYTNTSVISVWPSLDLNGSGTVTSADALEFIKFMQGRVSVTTTSSYFPQTINHYANTGTGISILDGGLTSAALARPGAGAVFITSAYKSSGFIQNYLVVGNILESGAPAGSEPGVTIFNDSTQTAGTYITAKDPIDSTGTMTGALVVNGGVGISGALNIGGNVNASGKILLGDMSSAGANTRTAWTYTNTSVISVWPSFDLNGNSQVQSSDTLEFIKFVQGRVSVTTTSSYFPQAINHYANTGTGISILDTGITAAAVGRTSDGAVFITSADKASGLIKNYAVVGNILESGAPAAIKPGVTIFNDSTQTAGTYITATDPIDSTGTMTGALVVNGGVGVGGALNISGSVNIGGKVLLGDMLSADVNTRSTWTYTNTSVISVWPSLDINGNGAVTSADTLEFVKFVQGRVSVTTTSSYFPQAINHYNNTGTGISILDDGVTSAALGRPGAGAVFITSAYKSSGFIQNYLVVGNILESGAPASIKPGVTIFNDSTQTAGTYITAYNPIDSTGTMTGALVVNGGVGVGGTLNIGNILSLQISSAAPASPTVGMFAVADRVTWDPASKGSGNAYPVFYDGSAWNALY
jgi:uncharacterized cupin superfamily protein